MSEFEKARRKIEEIKRGRDLQLQEQMTRNRGFAEMAQREKENAEIVRIKGPQILREANHIIFDDMGVVKDWSRMKKKTESENGTYFLPITDGLTEIINLAMSFTSTYDITYFSVATLKLPSNRILIAKPTHFIKPFHWLPREHEDKSIYILIEKKHRPLRVDDDVYFGFPKILPAIPLSLEIDVVLSKISEGVGKAATEIIRNP